eukprot:2178760-Prymnesium_polylepis.1
MRRARLPGGLLRHAARRHARRSVRAAALQPLLQCVPPLRPGGVPDRAAAERHGRGRRGERRGGAGVRAVCGR